MNTLLNRSWALLALAALTFTSAPAWGQADPLAGVDVIRVEEDWVLDVADPDPAADCPQIVTVFGPSDPETGTHCLFELNHGTLPGFVEGGMQIQVWWGDYLVGYKQQFAPTELYVAVERVSYTTITELNGSHLDMFVNNGQSVTWGTFGSNNATGSLKVQLGTSRTNLNNYDAENSVTHSKVSYGANRVNQFMRTEVRYYTAAGLHHTDESDRVVHQLATPGPPPVN